MDADIPSPQTTLVVLLGASEWPDAPDFHGSKAFSNAAHDFRSYLLDPNQFGLPEENLADLFDIDDDPYMIDKKIRHFLDQRTSQMKQAGNSARDLLVYFVGHGGFVGRNSEYYLAIRRTSTDNPRLSGIPMESFASTITEKARYLRRIIILDCCYAAAAFTTFQAEGPAKLAIRQTYDIFDKKAKTVGKGTTLLCSSGKTIASQLLPDGTYTMFSKGLLQVLLTGTTGQEDKRRLTLREVADLTEEAINTMFDGLAPRPELHSPDQLGGDVADVPFFPNLAGGVVSLPAFLPPTRHPTRFSRRRIVAGLLVGTAVIATGGSLLWLELSHPAANHVPAPPLTNAPMFGFDAQHTRFNPNEHILSTANVSSLAIDWSYPTGEPLYGFSPVIANGIVCIGSSSRYLYGINASTGVSRWAVLLGRLGVSSSPAISNGMVFAGSYDNKLYAVDVSTGAPLWTSISTEGIIGSPPTVVNEVLYVGSDDGRLYAFDESTGNRRWTSASTGGPIKTSPAVANGVVYIGSNGKLYAFDVSTGRTRWMAPMSSSMTNSSPAVSNNTVYIGSIGSDGGKLYTFNATTGAPGWTALTGTNTNNLNAPPSSPAVSNNTVFIGSTDRRLYTFNATTGAPGWTALTGDIVLSSPILANEVVYVGSADGKLYAFVVSTGKKLLSYNIGTAVYSSPTVVNGLVYVGADDGKLYAFHLP